MSLLLGLAALSVRLAISGKSANASPPLRPESRKLRLLTGIVFVSSRSTTHLRSDFADTPGDCSCCVSFSGDFEQ